MEDLNDNKIIIKKINDLLYSIEFETLYDSSSNFIEIINNKIIGSLLYELNNDVIYKYSKINNHELLMFNNLNTLLDTNYYLYFKYDVENINNTIVLNILLNNYNNIENKYDKIELEYLIIYINLIDNNIKFKIDFFYKKELSQLKIDIIIFLLKKIIIRLKKYIEY